MDVLGAGDVGDAEAGEEQAAAHGGDADGVVDVGAKQVGVLLGE